ncbi:hypothetical protein PanWU01x14_224160, partial [Parasponia andersonii]
PIEQHPSIPHEIGHLDNPNTFSSSSHSIEPTNDFSDLNILIAPRKGVRSCTQNPIAKYLSYHGLSENHRAFISNISNLFVPRTIQEALNYPNRKLAVQKEMNALQKNGT